MTAVAPPEMPATSRLVFAWIAGLLTALLLGTLVAYGPAALRRPLLTPVALGVISAVVVYQLTAPNVRPIHRLQLTPLVTALAMGTMHREVFLQIQHAALTHVQAHPADAQALALSEQLVVTDPTAAPRQRRLRLLVAPTWSDYLSERAASMWGERAWPWPAVWLGSEFIAAIFAAALTTRQLECAAHSTTATLN